MKILGGVNVSAVVIDGKKIAKEIRSKLTQRISEIEMTNGVKPGLATVIVGGDPASKAYVKNKEKVCREAGLNSITYELPEETSEAELVKLIIELNTRKDIHGILVQVPLPKHISENKVAEIIDYNKDVDGFSPINSGKLLRGEKCLVPCTAKGIIRLIEECKIPIAGKKAVVIGRSNIVGKPASMLLLKNNATVSICHSRTKNLKDYTKDADIVVCAVGNPGLLKGDMVKEGAAIIDAGTTVVNGKLVGDVIFDEVVKVAGFITPVPGGVGAMTTTMLIENVLEASGYYE